MPSIKTINSFTIKSIYLSVTALFAVVVLLLLLTATTVAPFAAANELIEHLFNSEKCAPHRRFLKNTNNNNEKNRKRLVQRSEHH